MIALAIVIPIALLVTGLQTYVTLRLDRGVGIVAFGVPAELVLGILLVGFVLLSQQLEMEGPTDIVLAIATGCLASYASTWGRAFGFAIHGNRQHGQDDV